MMLTDTTELTTKATNARAFVYIDYHNILHTDNFRSHKPGVQLCPSNHVKKSLNIFGKHWSPDPCSLTLD